MQKREEFSQEDCKHKKSQQRHSVSWDLPKIHPTLKSRQLYHVFSVFSLVFLGWLFCSTSHHQVRAYICLKPKPYLQFTDKETEAKYLRNSKSRIYKLSCLAYSSNLNSKTPQARIFSLHLSQSVHDFI